MVKAVMSSGLCSPMCGMQMEGNRTLWKEWVNLVVWGPLGVLPFGDPGEGRLSLSSKDILRSGYIFMLVNIQT